MRALIRCGIHDTLTLDCPPPEPEETHVHCLSHPIYHFVGVASNDRGLPPFAAVLVIIPPGRCQYLHVVGKETKPQKKCNLLRSHMGFPGAVSGKEPTWQCRRHKRCKVSPWVGKIPWRRAWQPTPVFLPGESPGERIWWATVHGVTKSQTRLKRLSMQRIEPRSPALQADALTSEPPGKPESIARMW